MEPPGRVEVSPPADQDVSQSVGQSSINQLGPQSHHSACQDQRQLRQTTDDWEIQQQAGHGLDLDFQDSSLSPALPLLPSNSGVEPNFAEYSLFQQSEHEFAPLRAFPDLSMASGRFHFPPQDLTTQASERGSLSQHPLAQTTILSEERGSSSSSLSQHSLSPGVEDRQVKIVHSQLTATTDRQGTPSRDDSGRREKDTVTPTNPLDKLTGEDVEDETFFLSKHVPAEHLLQLLQKDVGMPSSSSSAVSSASGISVKSITSFADESKSMKVCKPGTEQRTGKREGPPGEASLPQQQAQQPDRVSHPDQSRTQSSEVCNITMGSRSTQPDSSTEMLHRELLCEVERRTSGEAESKKQQWKDPSLPGQCLTPFPTETSEGKPGVTRTNLGGIPWTGPFSAGVERVHREHDLWSSGNQTGIDGSYLGFLPQSQSTPGVFKPPSKSSVKAPLGQLSAIESNRESSTESSTGISPQPALPEADVICPDPENRCQEEHTSSKVQSLPSLNYMQKVDAWRTNQSSGKTSLFDSLALQGFSGISPKKKAYDAVSDTLNRILSQHAKSLQQPPVSSAPNQSVTQSSSTAPSGSSSPRRGEAVGSAPSDKDNTGSAARPSVSSFGRSQSHSSLSTVVMMVQKDQQTEPPAEKDTVHTQDDVCHQPSATAQLSSVVTLGQFSDVSDLMLSGSQDSYNSGVKLGASIGASSVTSLEVDNYAPYWISKPSTPLPQPRPRELNIEERIPLYLHNLGIDQSPSTILTPFAPRGPIREPEFSPTDLCTIKGSIGTPSKSTQPSEGGSPLKGEFSRCSVLSVDSSVSLPFSMDSLGPAVSIPERPRRASPSSDIDATQSKRRLALDFHSSTLQPSQHLQRDSSVTSGQSAVQLGGRRDPDLSSAAQVKCGERDSESSVQTSRGLAQSAEDSFVGSKALFEIRKLLSQVENVVSASSSSSSASPTAPRLLSDDDIFLSLRKKTSRLQDSSFSSSAPEESGPHSSLLWARSSSDSMLTSEKPRLSSVGRESMASSWQPDYPSTQSLFTSPSAGAHKKPPDSSVSGGTSLVLSKSARRAEPEGCSAAPPDTKVPAQPPLNRHLPAVSAQLLTPTPADTVGAADEEDKTEALGGPVQSNPSSPSSEDTDQGVISDGSSDSSLAVRVAKLLQSESPATMVSSTPSITDHEESKAREWIKLKVSGQQCEPLELDKEDRDRIEEIKRELLLKNPMKIQLSTDTESSAASSVSVPRRQDPPPHALSEANKPLSQPPHGPSTKLPHCSAPLQTPLCPALEAQVREIAAREGVTLPRTNPRALTSITIATRRRSTSPSPSTSPVPPISPAPEPLHLTELSTATAERQTASDGPHTQSEDAQTARDPASVLELSGRLYARTQNLNSLLMSGSQRREDAVGGRLEEPSPPSQGVSGEREDIKEDNTQPFRQDDDLSIQDASISGATRAEQTAGSSSSEAPAGSGHVSHVRVTLSPKATAGHSSHADAVTLLPRREFGPLRHSPSAPSSPDEGVGSSSPPEWHETRGHVRADTSTLFKTIAPQGRPPQQPFTPRHRRLANLADSPAVPVLLPYKPHGSEELFYVPQTEADVSSTGPSDTTMESSHTGSDDAVPPRFSIDVLGHQDPGLDRGVTIRHAEGIYSKRLKTAAFKMQEAAHTDSQVSVTRVPPSNHQGASKRDQGTSPVQFLHDHAEPTRERPQPVRVGQGFDRDHRPVPEHEGPRDQQRRDSNVPPSVPLDQLWQRFCDRWAAEESRPTTDREASLLERLERLSRLIHGTRDTEAQRGPQEGRRSSHAEAKETERKLRAGRSLDDRAPVPRQARTLRPQVQEAPAEQDGRASSSCSLSSQSLHLGPADRDESETLSTASGSVSSVDTARLIRVFGAHRVQHLKTGSSLSKLYNTINRQREGREQRRGRHGDPERIITPSETTGTDESTLTADSASTTSSFTLPSRRGPSKTLAAKKTVKLVNKGIQTGDLEIVINGTRRHTRDVGTTFPSPRESSSYLSSAERGRGARRSPSKAQSSQKQGKIKRSPTKRYPEGVSWFISADNLRSEARKENQREEEEAWRPSTAWFEPYSRAQPWREPLRQRHVQEERNRKPPRHHRPETDAGTKTHVSLQEALETRRPEFISRSTQRVKRLALQAEERKLQAVFTRERDAFFGQPGGRGRLPKPAGTALLRRAVPRKEMIQRSKQIYENLPEVQRRREEERRRAEYRSYRLNAQLYNKRITSRVLGRRTAWQ